MEKFHVKDKISEYIDRMLSQEEFSLVKEHLDSCPECMEEYEEMVKIIGHMNQMESLETPDSFVEKVHERIDETSTIRRFVKGLFFPLKIKIPLELAGVAAAALLVIYIIGIRGNQHVYELAYLQRSQPLPALQEQRMEKGAEVDETASLNEKVQPVLELEEKKAEKKDKRIGIEKESSPSKKDLSALEPQAKRMGGLAKVEEVVPTSKIVMDDAEHDLESQEDKIERKVQIQAKAPSATKSKKREKPSLEIADKEKEETKEDAFAEPTPKDEALKDIVVALGGKIIKSESNKDTQVLESLIIEIPSEKYQNLIQMLEKRGEFQKPYPAIKEKDKEIITIRLIIQK
jgi:hypothetical protein